MVVRLGLYFGGLAVDYATGQAESTGRVRYRAAQLRCPLAHPAYPQARLKLRVLALYSQML